jgi:hypothetical protein
MPDDDQRNFQLDAWRKVRAETPLVQTITTFQLDICKLYSANLRKAYPGVKIATIPHAEKVSVAKATADSIAAVIGEGADTLLEFLEMAITQTEESFR